MTKTLLSLTALTLLATGCSKDDSKPAGEPAAARTGEPAAAKKPAGPFAGWDMDARRAAFQGAHVTDGQAWQVDGDKVTIWNGTAEKTLELTLESPCSAKSTEHGADGSRSSTTHHYTIKDGALVMGLGDAGARRGGEAIACVWTQILTLDAAGTCTAWKMDMFGDKWESTPGTCGFTQIAGKELFTATVDGQEYRLIVDGDALLSEQLAHTHSEKAADFAAAKAGLAQK